MAVKTAKRPQAAPAVDREHGLHLLYQMLRIRRFEEKCYEVYSQQKIRGFMHLYDGEEACAVGVMEALGPEDAVLATYREHGQALARGVPMTTTMAELYGKQEGCSHGRGGSMHLFDASTRFLGGNGIVAGGLPLSIGLGLADKMQKTGRVTACFFGDGAMAEGAFHETLNLAVLWQVPVLFVLENNQYAMGTALKYSHGETELYKRAAAYGLPAEKVDGMDVLAVEAAARKAVAHCRAGDGPYFLELWTFRFRAHSMFDAELYRDKAEVEEWRKKDPIPRFIALLKQEGLIADADVDELEKKVAAEVDEAVAFAEAGTWEPIEEITRFVYSEKVTS